MSSILVLLRISLIMWIGTGLHTQVVVTSSRQISRKKEDTDNTPLTDVERETERCTSSLEWVVSYSHPRDIAYHVDQLKTPHRRYGRDFTDTWAPNRKPTYSGIFTSRTRPPSSSHVLAALLLIVFIQHHHTVDPKCEFVLCHALLFSWQVFCPPSAIPGLRRMYPSPFHSSEVSVDHGTPPWMHIHNEVHANGRPAYTYTVCHPSFLLVTRIASCHEVQHGSLCIWWGIMVS